MRIIIVLLLAISLGVLPGCSSTTYIRAVNPNTDRINNKARIYVDYDYYGRGEVEYSDSSLLFSSKRVKIRQKQCRSKSYFIKKDNARPGIMVLGLFFLWPVWLWSFGYKDTYHFEYICRNKKKEKS